MTSRRLLGLLAITWPLACGGVAITEATDAGSGGDAGSSGGGSAGSVGGSLGTGAGGTGGTGGVGGSGASGGTGGSGGSSGTVTTLDAGRASVDPRCPPRGPATGVQCSVGGLRCAYSWSDGCLCEPVGLYECRTVDLTSCANASSGTSMGASAPEPPSGNFDAGAGASRAGGSGSGAGGGFNEGGGSFGAGGGSATGGGFGAGGGNGGAGPRSEAGTADLAPQARQCTCAGAVWSCLPN